MKFASLIFSTTLQNCFLILAGQWFEVIYLNVANNFKSRIIVIHISGLIISKTSDYLLDLGIDLIQKMPLAIEAFIYFK